MGDINEVLASEAMKILLQGEIKKPISFMEDSLNELKAAFEKEKKMNNERNQNTLLALVECQRGIKSLVDTSRALNKQLVVSKEKIETKVPLKFMDDKLTRNNERIEKILNDSNEYRKESDKRARINQGACLDLAEKQKLFELDIEILRDSFERFMKDQNKMKESFADQKSSNAKAVANIASDAQNIVNALAQNVEEQNRKIDRIYEMSQKSSKRIKQDSVDLSKDVHEQFDLFEKDFENRINDIGYKRRNVLERLENLEQQMMSSMKAGKASKELDDFMKQVSYNARQIAKIHQILEDT